MTIIGCQKCKVANVCGGSDEDVGHARIATDRSQRVIQSSGRPRNRFIDVDELAGKHDDQIVEPQPEFCRTCNASQSIQLCDAPLDLGKCHRRYVQAVLGAPLPPGIEREVVNLHRERGIEAERVPLSGAAGGSFAGDVVIAQRIRAEVKTRGNGSGFVTLEKWLGRNDALFLRRDRADPLVVLPARTWFALLDRAGLAAEVAAASVCSRTEER